MAEISVKKYLLKNAKSNLIRVGTSTLATLVLTPFIIKSIGIDRFSYVSLTSFFVSFSSFFDLGLSKSLVYLLNDKSITYKKRCQYITGQGIVVLFICISLFILGLISILTGFEVMGQSLSNNDSYYYIVTISSFIVLIGTIFDQYQSSILESHFLLNYVNDGTTIKIMSLNIMYLINLLLWNNVYLYIVSAVISVLIVSFFYAYIINKHIRINLITPTKNVLKDLTIQALVFFRYSILNSIYASLPRLSIMYLSPSISYVGILDVINKLNLSVINVSSSLLRPLYSLTRNNPKKIAKQINRIMIINLFVGLLFVVFVLIFKTEIVNYFFHEPEIETSFLGLIFILYSLASSIYLITQPLSFYLMGEGRVCSLANIYLVNITLFVFLYLILKCILGNDILYTIAIANLSISIVYLFYLSYLVKKTKTNRLTVN